LVIPVRGHCALCGVPRFRSDKETAVLVDDDDDLCNVVDQQHGSIGSACRLGCVGEHPDGETEDMHAHGTALLDWCPASVTPN
jgi:hypothetical protein